MSSSPIRSLTEAALFAGLAICFSLIPNVFAWFTPSLGTIFLIIISLRRGLRYGLISGFIWGILHILLGQATILNIWQVIIEYFLAFTSLGVAGIFAIAFQSALKTHRIKEASSIAILASFAAISLRWFWHFIAGFIFWGSYAPKGVSPIWYSFIVNVPAGISTFVLVIVILLILIKVYPKVFLV